VPPETATKPLPRWAWLVAAAAGLIIGFILLRRVPAGEDGGEDGSLSAPAGQGSGGSGSAAPPLLDDSRWLEAFGLRAPGANGGGGSGGGGDGSGGGGGDGSGGGGGDSYTPPSTVSIFNTLQQTSGTLPAPPTQPAEAPTVKTTTGGKFIAS
jgi:hypothetical protein